MNILFVACSSHLYGANQSLLNMLSICDKYNCFVILPNDGPLVDKIKSMGISCKIIRYRYNCASHYNFLGYWMHFFYFSILNVCAVYEVVRFILAHKVEIVHTNNARVSVGFYAARYLRVKHVWHIREFLDLDFNMRPFKPFKKLCKDFNESDSIICVSEAVKEHFHIQGAKARVIYNAVDSVRNLHNIREKKESYFLYCGGLSEKKGIFDAIYSFSKMLKGRALQLYIAGTGPTHIVKMIQAVIQKENLQEKVVLLGYRSDSKELMRKAIALLMCSKHEAFGRVTAEAMLNDCLVIGRNSGGTPELIEHGKTGFLFNTNDELTVLMEKVLSMDTTDIRDRAKEKAINSFTEEVYAEQLKLVYDSLRW